MGGGGFRAVACARPSAREATHRGRWWCGCVCPCGERGGRRRGEDWREGGREWAVALLKSSASRVLAGSGHRVVAVDAGKWLGLCPCPFRRPRFMCIPARSYFRVRIRKKRSLNFWFSVSSCQWWWFLYVGFFFFKKGRIYLRYRRKYYIFGVPMSHLASIISFSLFFFSFFSLLHL
jgi:hypothetical protein